jgi:hypothetical protein
LSIHWEDVEEENFQEENEEEFDDDDRREDNRGLFIKGDEFEDIFEDTTEEEVIKQAEVPKSQEGIKKELNSGSDISDDPGTRLGRVWETNPDVDREEGFEGTTKDTAEVDTDMVKQDKTLLNREEVPEARTESTRKANTSAQEEKVDKDTVWHGDEDDKEKTTEKHLYEKLEGRDMMTDINLKNKHNETNVGRKRGNVRQEQADQVLEVLGHKLIGDERDLHDDGDDHDVSNVEKLSRQSGRTPMGDPVTKTLGDAAFQNKDKVHEKPETRAVMVDITDAAVLHTEYEASIKVHQGRELNSYEKPEKREMMIKSCSDTVFKNTLDKDPDKDKGHKKLK